MYSRRHATGRRPQRRLASLRIAFLFASPALAALVTLPTETLGRCPQKPLNSLPSAYTYPTCSTAGPPSPWTFAPHCALDTSTKKEKYCVYTAGSFNDHTGTSFIVQPEALVAPAALAELPRLDQRALKYLGTTTESNIGNTNPDLAYVTRSLPGKGIGTLATRAIRRGEIYMVSHPALVIDTELEKGPDAAIAEADRWALHEAAFMQLPGRERAAGLVGSTGGNRWEDIMRTNGFAVKVGAKTCSALFPEQARLNHACSPNSIIRFVQRTFALEAMAIRDIAAGEELTISCTPPPQTLLADVPPIPLGSASITHNLTDIPADLPSTQRAEALYNGYKFACSCPLCTRSPQDTFASDARREKIRNIKGHILSLTSRSNSDSGKTASQSSLLPLANELISLVKAEPGLAELKLREYLGELAVLLARLYEFEAAVGFARGAVNEAEGLGEDGKGDGPGAGMRANLEFLERKLEEIKGANAES